MENLMREGYKRNNSNLNKKKPRRKVLNTKTGIIYKSAADAAKETGISIQMISSYCLGKVEKYKGVWVYIEKS